MVFSYILMNEITIWIKIYYKKIKKGKILIINSKGAIIGLISLMGAIMTLTFVTLIL